MADLVEKLEEFRSYKAKWLETQVPKTENISQSFEAKALKEILEASSPDTWLMKTN